MTELEKEYVLIRQKRDEVPEGTLSCPDRNLAVFHHYRHYEGLRLLPSVCDSKLIQQTLLTLYHFDVVDKPTAIDTAACGGLGVTPTVGLDADAGVLGNQGCVNIHFGM